MLASASHSQTRVTVTVHIENRLVPVPAELLFDLVADVERYPEFLPMWKSARIRNWDGPSTYVTEQHVGLGPINERFLTRTVLARPARIDVSSEDKLFREFYIRWNFAPAQGGCRTGIELQWQVRSFLLQKGIDAVLPRTARMMVSAFETRARNIILRQRSAR